MDRQVLYRSMSIVHAQKTIHSKTKTQTTIHDCCCRPICLRSICKPSAMNAPKLPAVMKTGPQKAGTNCPFNRYFLIDQYRKKPYPSDHAPSNWQTREAEKDTDSPGTFILVIWASADPGADASPC